MARISSRTLRLSSNALTVLRRRYLDKNIEGKPVETPSQLFRRVANNVAQAERLHGGSRRTVARTSDTFNGMMTRLEFLPNSPTLMNAGRDLQQLSACFVLPVEDSLESIFDSVKHQALIHQSGGGTGFSFSHLRPKNDRVASTSGVASGPISFMRVFNMATEVIKQGGARRGANMGILRVDHPDILDFIAAKQNQAELTNFNISVGITDAFMRALERKQDYALINPRTGRTAGRLAAASVFDRIVEAAWSTGEPGVIFLDTINAHNPTPHIGRIESTNPCGEQPLLAYESCTLGSLNLEKFVAGAPKKPAIAFERLAEATAHAVRFLDNVLDMNQYPLPSIAAITKGNRKIGLGVMGFADLLIKLGIPYDSAEALAVGEQVMQFIQEHGHQASAELARTRGTFPNFKGSRLESDGQRLRNATVTTVAPTGTISIIADCSPGIEPLYGVSYARTVMDDVRLTALHQEFVRRARAAGIYTPQLTAKVAANESIQDLTEVPDNLRRLFVTAHDIAPEHHVRMQAAFQRYSDSGVSKTINLPAKATKADVAAAFTLAYQLGCKGLTVFRTGSREHQVLSCTNVQYC
ncbi:MAG: adenosylcobalamin-dependent ribonucleoside-diphosphate reductase [Nitrospiraceae bacterium]|nr:adenosylcobalamin-dependent ribonucleoside-diphosphate reductase [Nitrospiraceae bacterium]